MSSRVVLSDDQFMQLRLLLAGAAGLVFDASRRESLCYALAERLRATGRSDVGAYLDDVARAASPERQQLIDEVTIQETHFFRNPPQIRALRTHVLPELVRTAAAGSRRIRVWSAGCSTGEEAYTLAMLLRELLPSTDGWDVKVLATDVSERALTAAATATYGARAVQMVAPVDLDRFFRPTGDGRHEVRPEVRELVELRHHNLVTEPVPFAPGDRADLVLCRNVTIYFGRDTTRALMQRLHGCLRDGGYLFLGHSETLWQVSDDFRLVALGSGDSAAFVYRRLDPAGTAGPDRRSVLPDRRTGDDALPLPERRRGARRGAEPLGRWPVAGGLAAGAAAPTGGPAPAARRGLHTDPLDAVRTALAEGRYDDAALAAADVADADPLRGPAHYLHGRALVELGRDDEALVALRKAVYLEPDSGLGHFLLAGALRRCGHGPAAAREFRAAAATLGRRPEDATAPELGGRTVRELAELCARLGGELTRTEEAS